jgi:hypothetical protein
MVFQYEFAKCGVRNRSLAVLSISNRVFEKAPPEVLFRHLVDVLNVTYLLSNIENLDTNNLKKLILVVLIVVATI